MCNESKYEYKFKAFCKNVLFETLMTFLLSLKFRKMKKIKIINENAEK